MKPVRFWKMQVQELPFSERMFFKDAIRTLLAWKVLKEEFSELDLIQRILESEIQVDSQKTKTVKKWWVTDLNVRLLS